MHFLGQRVTGYTLHRSINSSGALTVYRKLAPNAKATHYEAALLTLYSFTQTQCRIPMHHQYIKQTPKTQSALRSGRFVKG